MSVKFIFVIFGGIVLSLVDNARILQRVKRQSLKVRITAKDDSIVLQYLSTSPVIKLQGYVLGLGGRFSKQNITLPVNGDPIEVDVEFNPKYLVAVHPVAEHNNAALGKKCKGHLDLHKPPQLTIDPRTPTSVFLTWVPRSFKDKGYKVGKECENERQYTVRYREKERDKKWKYQLCPTSETTIDNLKPNTVYEFGIRVTKAKEDGVWSKPKTYTTTVTPQPRSTTNVQSKRKSNKLEVNFNSGNTKHTRKPGLTEMTEVKGLGAPSSANNRTNWALLLPGKPDLNTKAVIERTRDRMRDKEGRKEETTNTVSKPALKGSKTRKENDKPAMKPLTTKESKLSSSATPSFPSKPMLNSGRPEIQLPVFLTPSTASEHDTMDEFTEPETPSSTKMPFNTLRTTSDHADVGNQDLPEIELPSSSNSFLNPSDTPSALDSMEAEQFTEPEMPPTSSKLFDPPSEADDMDTQTFTEPKIRYSSTSSLNPVTESVTMDTEIFTELPSSTSSFSSSSDMVSKPDVVHTEWFTEYEEPSSSGAFYIYSPKTPAPDNVDNKQFTERVVEPTTNSFFTTSNTIYEFDSPQREQISEFGKPFLSSSPVNSLESSKDDAVEPKQSTESSFTTSKALITSNPIIDADNKVQQPFADYALLDSDTPVTVYDVDNPEEKESTVPAFDTSEVFTLMSDNELVASDSSHVFNPITQTTDTEPTDYEVPMYDINNVSTLMADHEIPVTDTPNVIYPIPEPESVTISDTEPTDHAMSTFHTPKAITIISGSELPNPGMFNPITQSERPEVTGYTEPTADTPNMFRPRSGSKPHIIDTPVFISIPESVPTKIRVTEVADHAVSSSETPNVVTLLPGHKQPVSDSPPYVLNPAIKSEPAKIGFSEVTEDHELSTSHTTKVFTLISGYERQATDIPSVINPIPEPDPAKIGEAEFSEDHELQTSHTTKVFTLISGYERQTTDIPSVINPISEPNPAKLGEAEFAEDHELSTSYTSKVFTLISGHEQQATDIPNVINPIPEPDPAKIEEAEVTEDHELSISHTTKVFTLISGYEQQVTDIPSVINPIPEPDPTKIGETDVTEDHELSTSHTSTVFTLVSGHVRQATDIPSVINPIPEPDPAEIGEAKFTEDHELSTSHTTKVFTLISGYERQATDIPSVINPIPEPAPTKIGETDVTEDHELSTSHTTKVFTLISGYERQATDIPSVINAIPESDPAKIGEAEFSEDHELSTSHTSRVFTLISGHEQQATGIPSVINPIPEPDPAKIAEAEFTEDHELPTSHTSKLFTLISGYERQATDIPSVINPIPEPAPTKIGETDVTEDHELSTSHTSKVFTLISGHEQQATGIPSVINPIPEPDPAKIAEAEFTEDHELSTSHTSKWFTLISGYERQATDIPSVINPNPEPDPTKIGETDVTDINVPVTDISNIPIALPESDTTKIEDTEVTADQVVPTSDTTNVFTFMLNHELPVADVIDPILESQLTKIRDTEVADHVVSTSRTPKVLTLITGHDLLVTDTPNVINPIPETERAKIKDFGVTDHEVPTSNMFSLIPDSDPPATDIPNILNPITKSEDIGDIEVTDDEVPSSDIPSVVTLMPNYVLPLTDTPNTINPIPEPERANVKDTEVKDHEVKISEATTNVFTLMPDGGLPVTDIPNVINPIPEPEHAKISDTEDHEPSTSKTAKLSNPTHVYNAGEKKQTDHKLPISDTSHVFIPTSVSEIDHIEDKKFTDHNQTNSGTTHVFDQAPISERGNTEDQELKAPIPTNSETSHTFSSTPELGKKENKDVADYTQLIYGTPPNMFNQDQESALDNIENKDLADDKFSSSDTRNVFRPTTVSQVGSTGKKDHSVSDPPKERSSIITSNPVRKTNAKVDHAGAKTPSTVIQSSSSSSGITQGTHVKYMTKVNMPCSITESLKHFPEENNTNAKFPNVPRYPPSNVTLVTIEGCPTFLIVDWMKNENDTASEYEVVSQMQGPDNKTEKLVTVTNQTHTAVENLKPNTSYTFSVTSTNVHGRGPPSDSLPFVTESADLSVSEYIPGKDAIWTQYSFKFDSYSECQGKRFVKRTRYRKFVGIVLCNSLRYKIYLSNSLSGIFYNIGDLSGHGEDHCQFVDSFLDGRTGEHLLPEQLPIRQGFYRSVRQEPVMFGTIGGQTHIHYVHWYECGIAIPGQW
ncbi:uncharacterized protein LOC144598928 isoform X6 [Rhinoraja longicauda]